MDRKNAPWFFVTLYDAEGCELATDEVQGIMNARIVMRRFITDPEYKDATRATIEQRVGDGGVIVDDVRRPEAR